MAKHGRHEEEEHENEERWLLTYADLITLLMVFFVVMYSLSKVDAQKFKAAAASLRAAFHNPMATPLPLPGTGGQDGADFTTKKRGTPEPARVIAVDKQRAAMEQLAGQFTSLFREEGLEQSVNVSVSGDGKNVVVRLADSLLFDAGSATLTPPSLELIDKMFEILGKTESKVQVEGHTDNVPINNAQFKSNWDLSTARAVHVVEHVIAKFSLPPERLSASGYAEYHPIAANDTPENRAKNRRVEFIISGKEPPQVPAQ